MELRKYQKRAVDMLWDWLNKNSGNVVLEMPTGSGKSVVISAICKDAIDQWKETRILMLCSQKELIEQNAEKLRKMWPNAPLGIYSASIGKRQVDAITFAGIQTVRNKASELGRIDLTIVDECDLISHNDEGSYRSLINELLKINKYMRVVGLTASPYRLGHGLITDKPAIFDEIINPTSIEELQALGFLSKLRSKTTDIKIDVSGVHKRGGDYIESELQEKVDNFENNNSIVDEIILKAGNRKSWLIFCSGIKHSEHIKELLISKGIDAEIITGETNKQERERIIADFKSGKIRALTNDSVLARGFDYPDIDLIAFLRPTCSPSRYVQWAGRGLRLKSHTDHCMILDFAGVIAMHGPITFVNPPSKEGEGDGIPPCKSCPDCGEICHAAVRVCPSCGYQFPPPPKPALHLRDDDIQGSNIKEMAVYDWNFEIQTSRTSGKEMLVVTYFGGEFEKPIREYLCIFHEGFAGKKGLAALKEICTGAGLADIPDDTKDLNDAKRPSLIKYVMEGKYTRVVGREWKSFDEESNTSAVYEDSIPF